MLEWHRDEICLNRVKDTGARSSLLSLILFCFGGIISQLFLGIELVWESTLGYLGN